MPDLDDGATRLRSGVSVWQAVDGDRKRAATVNARPGMVLTTDVVIVGAGITGAFAAERLTRMGRTVVVIDRREPATGSTMASTAMLQWELDASLLELEDRLGEAAALSICRECQAAVKAIGVLADEAGVNCGYSPTQSILLAGPEMDVADMRQEMRLRELAGVESTWLSEADLAARGLVGDAGLLAGGAAAADPVKLTEGLLCIAVERGAVILSPATATEYQATSDGVIVHTQEGASVRAKTLVLANGYEIPEFVFAPTHSIVSSWALATPPSRQTLGEKGSSDMLVWEAADPYLYFRPGPDGRVIAGGEDVDTDDAGKRDALTAEKTKTILAKLGERKPGLRGQEAEFAWAGFFGETEDSLPLIGPAPGYPGTWAAFGYGGNGIAFSAIAAEMLSEALEGRRGRNADYYALERPA